MLVRSTALRKIHSASIEPPSLVETLQRLKPVAISWSLVAFGQQIAGELLDGEAVERHVVVEGRDDPVAIEPHLPFVVEVQAVRVGVAGDVEPVAGHLLAVMLRGEIAIDHLFVSIRRVVREERVHLGERRRQPGQRERDAANERRPIRFRRQGQVLRAGADRR